jgi:hypothetical protein
VNEIRDARDQYGLKVSVLKLAFRRAASAVISLAAIFAALSTVAAQYPMSEGKNAVSSDRELEEHVARMRYLVSQANKRKPGPTPRPETRPRTAARGFHTNPNRKQGACTNYLRSRRTVDFKFVARSPKK